MAPSDVKEAPTIAERVENMSGEQFANYLTAKWNAVEERLIAPIREGVVEGEFTPLEGAKIASCVTGEIFGYSEFHGSALSMPVSDLLNSLAHRTKEYNR